MTLPPPRRTTSVLASVRGRARSRFDSGILKTAGSISVSANSKRAYLCRSPRMAVAQDAPMGSIVKLGRAPAGPRASDRNIVAVAAGTVVYCPIEHRAIAEWSHSRGVPGADPGL
jgi:hypothetical protein